MVAACARVRHLLALLAAFCIFAVG